MKYLLAALLICLTLPGSAQDEDACHNLGMVLHSYSRYEKPKREPPKHLEITDMAMRGIHQCPLCGESINMGFMKIRNTEKDRSVWVFFMAIHVLKKHKVHRYSGRWVPDLDSDFLVEPEFHLDGKTVQINVDVLNEFLKPAE